MGAVSGSVVFFSDFFDFDLVESVVVSVEVSLLGSFSVLVSVFFFVLLVESAGAVSVFVDSEVVFFFVEGLVALSAAGLFVVVDDLVEGAAGVVGGAGVMVAAAAGVMVAAAAGVMVAPTLAVAAGVALAFVDAVTPVVVLVVGTVLVVPVVAVTPTLKLGVTP